MQQFFAWLLSLIMSFLALFGIGGTPAPQPEPDPTLPATPVYVAEQTLAYGDDANQTVDLYLPAGKSGEVGLLLFLHGGAWTSGSKESYTVDAKQWQARGYAAATMNYRFFSSEVRFSDELDDITAALSAIKAAAAASGMLTRKVILVGISAGAHLALLYAYTRTAEAPVAPAAVISSSAPTDFTDPAFIRSAAVSAYIRDTLGMDPEFVASLVERGIAAAFIPQLKEISPAKRVTAASVPTLFAHGTADEIVPFSNAERLDAALTQAGVTHDFVVFENAGHALRGDLAARAQMATKFVQYVNTYLP